MPKVFNNQVFIDFLAQLRPDEQHQYNSPWNIAAEFNIDMSCPHAFIRMSSYRTQVLRNVLQKYVADNENEVVRFDIFSKFF